MSNVYQVHAASLAALQTELGDECPVFTWDGSEYKILPGSVMSGKQLELGGYEMDIDLAFTCLVEAFSPDSPEALKASMLKTRLVYRGENFTIQKIHLAPTGRQMHVEASAEKL